MEMMFALFLYLQNVLFTLESLKYRIRDLHVIPLPLCQYKVFLYSFYYLVICTDHLSREREVLLNMHVT